MTPSAAAPDDRPAEKQRQVSRRPLPPETDNQSHRVIEPSVLYLGTPVLLVATQNPDGSANLAPASSHFALDRMIVVGLEEGGQSLDNVRRHPELTINFPSADQWTHVERLAGVTGKNPVPPDKTSTHRFEPRKFERAGLTPTPSNLVTPPRVNEAPIQLEAKVARITAGVSGIYGIVEAEVVRVHAADAVTVADTDHIDPFAWHPLIYAYRHFFDRGDEVGWTRKTPFNTVPSQIARWQGSGGTWHINSVDSSRVSIDLLEGHSGEVAETLVSDDPTLIRWAHAQEAAQ